MHLKYAAISTIATGFTSTFAFNASDPNCVFTESPSGVKAECTFRDGTFFRKVPSTYSNMLMTIYSGSGGAALDAENEVDDGTRGRGVKLQAKITDNAPKTGDFKIRTHLNGQDASPFASGDRTSRLLSGGRGGKCPPESIGRYAGAGGDVTMIEFFEQDDHDLPANFLTVGGVGGAGAFNPRNGISKGGDAALIDRANNLNFQENNGKGKVKKIDLPEAKTTRHIISPGLKGLPEELSGFGGIAGKPAAGGKGVNGHRGEPGIQIHNNEADDPLGLSHHRLGNGGNGKTGFTYCLAGGGGGDGHHPGGGGGAYGTNDPTTGSAGSGGGGSSEVDDEDLPMYEIVHQENHYDPDPRVIVTFDVQEPVAAPAGKVPGKGCTIC